MCFRELVLYVSFNILPESGISLRGNVYLLQYRSTSCQNRVFLHVSYARVFPRARFTHLVQHFAKNRVFPQESHIGR